MSIIIIHLVFNVSRWSFLSLETCFLSYSLFPFFFSCELNDAIVILLLFLICFMEIIFKYSSGRRGVNCFEEGVKNTKRYNILLLFFFFFMFYHRKDNRNKIKGKKKVFKKVWVFPHIYSSDNAFHFTVYDIKKSINGKTKFCGFLMLLLPSSSFFFLSFF